MNDEKFIIVCIKDYFQPGMSKRDDQKFLVGDRLEVFFETLYLGEEGTPILDENYFFQDENNNYLLNNGENFIKLSDYRDIQINTLLYDS